MIKILEMLLDSLISYIISILDGKVLLEIKEINKTKTIINVIVFSILLLSLNLTNIEILDGVIKIICIYTMQCIFYKLTFNKDIPKCMISALIWYLSVILCEATIGLTATIILEFINESPDILKNNLIMNILISSSTYIVIYILRKRLRGFVKNNKYIERSTIVIITATLIILALIGFKRPITNWTFDIELVLSMIMLLCFCIIGFYMLKQKSDIEKTSFMYQQLAEYSEKTSKVLEEYRIVNHEHKNQLSIIRQLSDKKNKKLIEYLDNLLKKKNDIKYKWISDLKYIPLNGLKGLINYKLLEMEDNKIEVSVNISKDIEKIKLNKLSNRQKDNLYSIIGVYLDNAIEASINSKEKQVGIEIYKDKKELVFIIGNTYRGNIDLEKIDEYGYSSKGKNRGIGLHIVNKILAEDKLFQQTREILNNYFIEKLVIDTDIINKK